MNLYKQRRAIAAGMVCLLTLTAAAVEPTRHTTATESASLWAHDNLVASGLLDTKSRSVEERAQMLEGLGIKQVTLGGPEDVATLDAQIDTLQQHGIRILGWFVDDLDEPTVGTDWKRHKVDQPQGGATATDTLSLGELLEAFKRHGIKPQLWVARNMRVGKSTKPFSSTKPFAEMTDEERNQYFRNHLDYDPTPPQERALRVREEADHLKPLAQLAATYGMTVALYKHGGWIGIEDNRGAVIERLKALGVSNVGLVYRFIHAHDEVDDTVDFPAVWNKIRPYVRVVDITGLHAGRTTIFPILYPSQGELELKMMKTIQDSGWRGTIGVSAEKGGDAEVNLRHNLSGLNWIAAELKQPGSGGPRPFPSVR